MLLSPDFCFFLGRCRSCASEIERLCTGIPMISALSNIGLLNWSLRVASRSQTTTPCVSETCHRFMINAGRCAFPKAPRGSWSSSPLPSLSVAASAMSKTQSSRLRRLAAVLATMLSCLLPPGRAFGMRGTKATLVASSPVLLWAFWIKVQVSAKPGSKFLGKARMIGGICWKHTYLILYLSLSIYL